MRLTVLKNHVLIHDVQVDTPDLSERYEIYVGRSEDCHVVIDDPLISRHHFSLKNENGKWICEKLTQLGVVSINGHSSGKIEVQDGDEIKFGAYTILVSELPSTRIQVSAPVQAYQPQYLPDPEPLPEQLPVAKSVPALAPEPQLEEAIEDSLSLDELDDSSLSAEAASDDLSLDESQNLSDDFGGEDNFSNSENTESESLPATTESFDNNQEEGFGGDENALTEADDGGDEKTSFFKAFVNYQLVIFGDHAPYDRYQIDTNEIFIGRDAKKCQIVLDDPEVSSVHAVLRKTNIDVTLEDLNSSNGTILNGERINKAHLSTGDEFIIGSTTFTLETRSDLLDAEADRLMPVESGQTIEKEEIEEEVVNMSEMDGVDFNSEAPAEKSIIKRVWKNPAQRKKLIYVLAGLALVWVLFGEEEQPSAPSAKPETSKTDKGPEKKEDKKAKVLSKELEERRNTAYELGVSFFEQNKYFEALKEFQTVMEIDDQYKKVQTYFEQTNIGLKRLEELEAQKRAEEERIKTKKIIEELLVKAREAVKEKQVQVAESLFSQITEKDPENIEVQQLKMELEAWQKEQERIAFEKAAKEAARKAMVDALNPGKAYYLKKEWYRAILKLEEFLRKKGMDEDLIKEGSDMLADAKEQLSSELGPLVGKARSLKEGQDLKAAYEAYLEVLKVDPTNSEALNEVDDIREQLDTRSKKIYREAIIAESLSLFGNAKEKFQEVQQISPTDSEYYKKASDKLKNYLE